MKLTADNVNTVYIDCLYERGEDISSAKVVDGVQTQFHFHPERLESHRKDVKGMLSELPDEFKESSGSFGESFLNGCVKKDGEQWADHPHVEALFAMGMGLDLVHLVVERKMWFTLRGNMPYYLIKDKEWFSENLNYEAPNDRH